ncbi:MAG TPA: TRAP transporter substrate-binding protein DctP [Bdellovibrionota bacterium]|nr:TRAP transporter substrate-binding protein DctP [Bdellovibrionota bacterium]
MPKLISTFVVVLIVAMSAAAAEPKILIKIATVAPQGTTWVNELQKMDQKLRSESQDEVGLKIYAGGVLGDESDVVRKIRVGQVHGAAFTGMGLGQLLPEVRIFELPFLARTDSDIDRLTDQLFPRFEKGFLSKKFVLLGFVPIGFVYIFSSTPISSLDALKKGKVWVWEGDPLARGLFSAGGVAGIPLVLPDVLSSLQTRLIDTVYGTPLGAIALQWHTRVKYRTDFAITHAMGALLVAEAQFSKLSAKSKEILKTESRDLCRRLAEASRKENAEALTILTSQGVQTVAVSVAEQNRFIAIGDKVATDQVGKLYPKDLLEQARSVVRSGAKP